jgi:hypothetical protein
MLFPLKDRAPAEVISESRAEVVGIRKSVNWCADNPFSAYGCIADSARKIESVEASYVRAI